MLSLAKIFCNEVLVHGGCNTWSAWNRRESSLEETIKNWEIVLHTSRGRTDGYWKEEGASERAAGQVKTCHVEAGDVADQRKADTWQAVWCDEEKFGFVTKIMGESGTTHFTDIKELWYTVYMNTCLNCITLSFLYT
ncbi:hypothetical protein Scep_025975 [Stephania cephalantha]|uniref:Uncharacterized protein n=1 Tax=Stephania cephalantha TaxID=152367 RepID=A0AAP0EJ88_9MAGN